MATKVKRISSTVIARAESFRPALEARLKISLDDARLFDWLITTALDAEGVPEAPAVTESADPDAATG